MTNKYLERIQQVQLYPIERYEQYEEIKSFTEFEFSTFVWDYTNKTVYVNKYMVSQFKIDLTTTSGVFETLRERLEVYSIETFYKALIDIKNENSKGNLDFHIRGRSSINWYKLLLNYDQKRNVTFGVINAIDEIQVKTDIIGKSKNMYELLLERINIPIYFTNVGKDIQFSNFELSTVHHRIYEDIENIMNNNELVNNDSVLIELETRNEKEARFKVSYKLKNTPRQDRVVRMLMSNDNELFVSYFHERLSDSTEEQLRLTKIIKANELMMEVRDRLDSISDLSEMFLYILSKVSSVIPEISRCCVLKRNEKDELYLDTSYGFEDTYVEGFKLPFKESFAYIHLQNNYSRSVIINDIQERYSDLFPEIKGDQTKFSIHSNIAVPIVIDSQLYGLVSVDSDQNRVFDDVDLYLLDYMKLQIEQSIDKFRRYTTIKKDSTQDSLTGVSNRRHLLETIEVHKHNEGVEHKEFYFVAFDIDGLKKVNDTYGHLCGDEVLKQFSFVIQTQIREYDLLSRIGGDEFVGLFYNITKEVLLNKLQNWKKHFSLNKIDCNGGKVQTKFSFGISKFPTDGLTFSELMEKADVQLYEQKKKKKRNIES